jgi:RND family efflux transporter MFP subunit
MKKILSLTLITLLFMSCGGNDSLDTKVESAIAEENIERLKELKKDISAEQKKLKVLSNNIQEALSKTQPKSRNYTLITAKKVKTDTFRHYLNLQGNVKTDQNIMIYPEYSGKLLEIYVKEGQKVKEGELLAVIDDGGLKDQQRELRTRVKLLETTFERQKRLWNDSIGSEIQYLQAKTDFESTQSALNSLTKQLKKTVIRAPFDGTIDDIITESGQVVMPGGMAIFRLVNLSEMYIETEVADTYLDAVNVNTTVEVNLRALNKKFKSYVVQTANFINPDNRKFKIKVAIPDSIRNVKPNLIANVLINDYQNSDAIIVSENIIQETANGSQVTYKVELQTDSIGKAIRIPIVPGKRYDGKVEIIEGITAGDIIGQEGVRNLRDQEDVLITKLEQ